MKKRQIVDDAQKRVHIRKLDEVEVLIAIIVVMISKQNIRQFIYNVLLLSFADSELCSFDSMMKVNET